MLVSLPLVFPVFVPEPASLAIDPTRGAPLTAIELKGENWPSTPPEEITVTWGFQGQLMASAVEIDEEGVLGGKAEIPGDAVGGLGRVEVCAGPGGEFVECATASFEVTAVVAGTPDVGIPGTTIALAGFGFPSFDPPRQYIVNWGPDELVIGSATADQAGVLTGEGVVPLDADEGVYSVQVCYFDVDAGDVCETAPNFEVVGPSFSVDPAIVFPGDDLGMSGEGWCCDGDFGSLIYVAGEEEWGTASVDELGTLTGEATVPVSVPPGPATLSFCLGDYQCREVEITVEALVTTTTSPTTTTTTVISQECAVVPDSIKVDPESGKPGTSVLVRLRGAEDSPPECMAFLRVAGEELAEPFLLQPGIESVVGAVIPMGIATGRTAVEIVDLIDGTALGAATFDITDGPSPWIPVATGGALTAFGGLAFWLLRRARRVKDKRSSGSESPEVSSPVVPMRWIEARLFARHEGVEIAVEYFRPGTTHRVEVRLSPSNPGHGQPDRQRLRVVLTEPNLLAAPQSAVLDLTGPEPSTSASFTITTDPTTTAVHARLLLVNGTRVVQTAHLPVTVGAAPPAPSKDVADTETVVRASTLLPEGGGVAAAFVVDTDDGVGVTEIAAEHAARIALSDSASEAVERIRSRLGEMVEAPADFTGLESEGTRELLVFLAHHGVLLRSAIVSDFLGERLAALASLQVVSAAPDSYLPLELAYDLTAPRIDANVCPHAGDALRSAHLFATCPGPHDETVVCPFGFWGISKVIERHAYQPRQGLPAGFLVRAQPVGERRRIALAGGGLLGASHRVNGFDPRTFDHLFASFSSAAGAAHVADSWTTWEKQVLTKGPSVLLLLPHTVHSAELGTFGLQIGAADTRWAAQIDKRLMPDHPVVVGLLGCETAVAGRVSYERFPGLLRRAGAEIVVATLTEILGRQAAPLAERFVSLLYDRYRVSSGRIGEVMVELRRLLLAEGFPAVLTLAVFGDADWVVGGT